MALVEVKNISFEYPNGYRAVDDVSFSIEAGENIAIVGQNGAGKTTTVKMLNGLTKPCSGDVLIDGRITKNYTTAQMARTGGICVPESGRPDLQLNGVCGDRVWT